MKHEEYRLIAGVLTLLVHAALAAVLITSWRFPQKTVQPVTVELWSAAPAKPQGQPRPARPRPHPEPAPAEAPRARPAPPKPAEIERPVAPRETPRRETAVEKPLPTRTVEPTPPKTPERHTPAAPTPPAPPSLSERLNQRLAQGGSASGPDNRALLQGYQARVIERLRNRVVWPDSSDNPVAEFELEVSAGMKILNITLARPSGDVGWDNAARRALEMNRQLPELPDGLTYNPQEMRRWTVKLCPKSCSR